jgi:hypothetical protein
MDTEDSGYISWKSFTRILLSLSPKHLLRSDITSFLATQVDNENDLINYQEFLITGKVLILESKEGVKEVLARSWYARQRGNKALREDTGGGHGSTSGGHGSTSGGGDSSSIYTWKNHLKWYTKRKSNAIIWLIRRANRAIQYYKYVETARSSLLRYGIWGKDLSYLIECGERALHAITLSETIKISLYERIKHAKKYKMKREEIRKSLFHIGQISLHEYVNFLQNENNNMISLSSSSHTSLTQQTQPKKNLLQQTKLSKIYKIKFFKENAFQSLLKYRDIALKKEQFYYETFQYLQKFGQKIIQQNEKISLIYFELIEKSEKARNYCMTRDSALIFLLKKSEKGLKHFDQQINSLNFLISLGQRSILFSQMKLEVTQKLQNYGQNILKKLNLRENSFEYLNQRAKNSQKLLKAKKEAYWMLTGFMRRLYANEENILNTFLWLKKRADRAKRHTENCLKSYRRLKTIAQRSVAVSRLRSMAHADLKQVPSPPLSPLSPPLPYCCA